MIWILFYIVVIVLNGFAAASLIHRHDRISSLWLAGISLAAGLGITGKVLFLASLAGVVPGRGVLVFSGVVAATIAGVAATAPGAMRVAASKPAISGGSRAVVAITSAWLFFAVAIVTIHALGHVTYEWDGYMIWGLKAKVVAQYPVMEAEYFHNLHYSSVHLNYPLMTPFLMAGVRGACGACSDVAMKLVWPLFYAAMVLMILGHLRTQMRPWCAFVLAAVYASMPTMLRWAGSGLADIPLATFCCGGMIYLCRWATSHRLADVSAAAMFMAFGCFTKNEGLAVAAVALIAALVIPASARSVRLLAQLAAAASVGAAMIFPWMWFRYQLPQVDENYLTHLSPDAIVANTARLADICQSLRHGYLDWHGWNLLWPLLLVSAMIIPAAFRRPAVRMLWVALLLHTTVYIVIYMITPADLTGLLVVTRDRLLLHISPVALLTIAATVATSDDHRI